jgi:hypothetical protein
MTAGIPGRCLEHGPRAGGATEAEEAGTEIEAIQTALSALRADRK